MHDSARLWRRTTPTDEGFLTYEAHASLMREGKSTPHRCRWCDEVMRWRGAGHGAMFCVGSCDQPVKVKSPEKS